MSLTPRIENVRNSRPIEPPIQFSLTEIKQHFVDSLDTVKAQYSVADYLASSGSINDCMTIWRSQVVLAEGLLDFYIHEISKFCLFRMFNGQWKKSEQYESFKVPMSLFEEAIVATETKNWFFDFLNRRFERDVFLSAESMRSQLNLIGIEFGATMMKLFPESNQKEANRCGEKIVEELYQRRNAIAHQNDRSHATAEQEKISKEFVEEYILKIEKIVNAIDEIATEKERRIQLNS